MTEPTKDAAWLREQLLVIFGPTWQTRFARFMELAGDHRPYTTIVRGITNAISGRYRMSGEMRVLVSVLRNPEQIQEAIKQAKREPGPPMHKLLPPPKVSAAPKKR